ncbi:heavy metal translocating P-type ATPase [Fervidibacillus halotolerans]|uniref:Heavy metal translocating P-type ATPase n=1 Tax=Fervidibacillus halotolerans TaxID=2980027 RepID=A0A9E8M2F3_9BACI|nr:heavy metal translocating P-type ATPase [Fervidibacillus halotolerans]WAA13852.1 heavy metal translocating P-type ATPase [Fervidibacillus halotolerans]
MLLHDFMEKFAPYIELAAALFSGVLIVLGWLFGKFDYSTASVVTYLAAYVIGGYAKAKEGILSTIEDKRLNVELLMFLAAIGSAIIGYWTEGAILIFIFAVSGALETYTMSKSRKEISALMELQPEEACLLKDGKEIIVPVKQLQVGDYILVRPGERIPADGKIVKGLTNIDESAITGESIPVSKGIGEEVFAGTVNGKGSIKVEITKPSSETLFQKIIELVQNAESEKSPSQQFIERFEGIYVNTVLLIVAIMMFLPHYLFGWSWNETIYRALVLLVVASPCAVVASIMPATLSAISNGAKNGILFKGGAHIETLGNIKAIAFDKTGTLTNGKPIVTDFIIKEGWTEEEVLQTVASFEKHSTHPLAQAIVNYARQKEIELKDPQSVEDISGKGIKAVVDDTVWKAGKADFMTGENPFITNQTADHFTKEGKTIVFIEREEEVVGIIALKDVIRENAENAISELQQMGIQTVMVTGDNVHTAKVIAEEIGINDYYAECLPQEKVNKMRQIHEQFETTAMVGDGINDAPALATASVGIAMGRGTDVALETADVILMKDDLSKIAKTIKLSKKMNRIIKQNLFFSIAVIILLIASNFFQVIDLPLGVIGHEGSTILVILNGLRLLKS